MKKMSALLLALGFCALAVTQVQASEPEALVSGKSYADFFSRKNMKRIEKASSLFASVGLMAVLVGPDRLADVFKHPVLGLLVANGVSNVVLGCGYKKDKKAFARTLIPISIVVPVMLLKYKYVTKKSHAMDVLLAGVVGLIVKECCDLYSVVKSYRNNSSTEEDQIPE